ncbi:MAG: D-lactate dehydrogenase [Verrucomicrobiota bacterium]|jgi:D-lactate dehydrogenase
MKIAVFSSKPHDREFLKQGTHEFVFFEPRLEIKTAELADGFDGVCLFVNDTADAAVIDVLAKGGCQLIALRCAGFNNVDLIAANRRGLVVCRVPEYSPHAVAEHAVALLLALNRKIHRSHTRIREGDFSINGLMGFDLHGKTVGIVGTGRIGATFARIMIGFGCRILACDPFPNSSLAASGVEYTNLPSLLALSDVISLHCPLTPESKHFVNSKTIAQMKPGVFLINTSRGKLINTQDAVKGLKKGLIGALGIDVYEEESGVFFENLSNTIINDDVLMRLITFPNVIITSHQGFFTREAVENIAATTLANIDEFADSGTCLNQIHPPQGSEHQVGARIS